MQNSTDNKSNGLTEKGNNTEFVAPQAPTLKSLTPKGKIELPETKASKKDLSLKQSKKAALEVIEIYPTYYSLIKPQEIEWSLKMKERFKDFPRLPKAYHKYNDIKAVHPNIQVTYRRRVQNWLTDIVTNNHAEKLSWCSTHQVARKFGYTL